MPPLDTLELTISGMTCANCAGRVERALGKVPGVRQASVNLATEQARVQLTRGLDPSLLLRAIEHAGYAARLPNEQPSTAPDRRGAKVLLALALALPLVAPMLLQPLGAHWMLPAWVQFALASLLQFGLGAGFYRGAWHAVRTLDGNMDLLVVLGTGAAYGLSLYQWLALDNVGHLYFETSAMVIALVLLGKYLEGLGKRRTGSALRALQGLRADTALRWVDGREQAVAVAQLALGDVLLVKPGARFATDGLVVDGSSHANEALISGESLPVPKQVGDRVTGGAINGEGLLKIRVTALGGESVLARIIRLVEDAQADKAPVQKLVDRISRVFVPVVVALAALTCIGWWLAGAPLQMAVIHAVAVLVIACPCALGLATPAAILAGTGAAARHGILIKNSEVLENARRIDCVAFDKTGTLTLGQPGLVHQQAHGDPSELLRLAGALQQGSEHPLAQALLRACASQRLVLPALGDSQALPGRGVAGQLGQRRLLLGNRRLLDDFGLAPGADAAHWEAQGCTLSWLIEPDAQSPLLGLFAFADPLRDSARAAVAQLRGEGIACHLLTGDNLGSANAAGQALGIEQVHGQLLPADKARLITQLKSRQVVAMVGDGINDAPALAAADLGIAMASGTDVAMQAAGITLMRGDPRLVPAALEICRRTYAKIRQNLFWAFVYNLLGIPLAALGYLSPLVAGTAMALSSVCVVVNALWLSRWRPAYEGAS
jgi:Cu+-exporting ATPase